MSTPEAYTTQPEFNTAVNTARNAAGAYYDTDTEIISDGEYDALVEKIETTLTNHPDWADWSTVSFTTQVAAGASAGGDVKHPHPMLSLGKVPTLTAVNDFIRNLHGAVVVEPKMDGLAVRATYTNGVLTQVVTRGDGQTGEDVTARAQHINGLPTTTATLTEARARYMDPTATFEVRGEVFMSDTDFKTACTQRQNAGKPPFANPRNGVAGALRKENPAYIVPMSFAAYDTNVAADTTQGSYYQRLDRLTGYGIQTAHDLLHDHLTESSTPNTIITWLETNRATLGYPIDGVVLKADTDTDRARLGDGSRAPKWAVAYKYEAETATTVIKDIEFALGRTGRLSIRARVQPVFVGGTTITYASGHNVGWMLRSGIRIGDTVNIKRANDVIPYIDAPDLALRPEGSAPWVPPTVCPNCGEPFDKTTELWRCRSFECSLVGRIAFAASRDVYDLDGMSEAIATALVESDLVSNIADVFTLTESELASLAMGETTTGNTRRLGHTNAAKIIAEIEKAKNQPFNRVITGMGMRLTGRTMGRRLASAFPTMELLRDASIPALCRVEGIAQGKAESIFNELRNMAPVIDALAAAGVNMGTTPTAPVAAAPAADGSPTAPAQASGAASLAGKTYVVSGSVPGYTRTTIQERIEALGGKASSSVSKATTALVTSETTTSKAVKAAQLGIPVIDPTEFAALLG
ncbi:MAG: NAD-dependent DNA ligase LigA [Propionicimonas sp.]